MQSSIELFFLHIPKTAGRSFKRTLRNAYGKQHSIRLNWSKTRVEVESGKDFSKIINEEIKVFSAHAKYCEIGKYLPSNTKIVTWLREPITRIISNYNYYISKLKENSTKEIYNRDKNLSFLDYCEREECKNLLSKYLSGIDLNNIFFFGFQESYSKDIKRLEDELKIELKEFNKNVGSSYNENIYIPSQIEIDKVRKLNSIDIAFYNKAKQVYNKRWVK